MASFPKSLRYYCFSKKVPHIISKSGSFSS
jgi:hypothetical protein